MNLLLLGTVVNRKMARAKNYSDRWFGERLKDATKRRYGTQNELARQTGLLAPTISRYMHGRLPAGEELIKLALAFPDEIFWILTGRDQLKETEPRQLQPQADLSTEGLASVHHEALRHYLNILRRGGEAADHIMRQSTIVDELERRLEEKEQTIKRLEAERIRAPRPHSPPARPQPPNSGLLQVADVARPASRRGAHGRRRPPRPCPE